MNSRKHLQRLFLKVFLRIVTILTLFVVVFGGSVYLISRGKPNPIKDKEKEQPVAGANVVTNLLVMGMDDKGIHTDVMFVVRYDTDGPIDLVSIPRDTKVKLTDEVIRNMEEEDAYYEKNCKINEVQVYSGEKFRNENSEKMVEDIIGYDIHYFMKIELEGFKKIVDAVGGVEVDVPQNMNYYDPTYDFRINLKKGKQVLGPDEALQLVRFRHYAEGDLDRIQVQQMFLKEFAKKVLNTETIMKNAGEFIKTAFQHVETDMPLTEALKYVKYINNISMDNLKMYVLPGVSDASTGPSYFINDESETRKLFDALMAGENPYPEEEPESEEEISDKKLKIFIRNGGIKVGFAAEKEGVLKSKGYNVVGVDTSNEKIENTVIYVKEKGAGLSLIDEFTAKPKIVLDSKQFDGIDADIIILIGLNE